MVDITESNPAIKKEKHRHMRVTDVIDAIGMSELVEVRFDNERSVDPAKLRQSGLFVGAETRYQLSFLLDANGLVDDVVRRAENKVENVLTTFDGVAKADVHPLPDHDKVSVRVIFDSSDLK